MIMYSEMYQVNLIMRVQVLSSFVERSFYFARLNLATNFLLYKLIFFIQSLSGQRWPGPELSVKMNRSFTCNYFALFHANTTSGRLNYCGGQIMVVKWV